MSPVRVGKSHAVFPPDYVETPAARAILFVARHSPRLRSMLANLPPSRPRTYVLARYFRQIYDDLSRGATRFSSAVHSDADMQLFNVGTFRGPAGWKEALEGWLDSFQSPALEMREWIQGEGNRMVCAGVLTDDRGGPIPVRQEFALCVQHEGGMAVWGHVYNLKSEALKAAGLSE